MRIYIVTGTSGSYDSERTWLVKAFRDESQASALAEHLNARTAEWIARLSDANPYEYPPADWFAEDPENRADYLGAIYGVESAELVEP